MAIRDDVLVVGGGLAGMTAALAASREGASVRVVTDSESTLQQASGLVDVLGYPDPHGDDGAREPVPNPFDAVENLPDDHPYRVVGVDALRAGLSVFDDATGDLYRGGHTDRNALVPTVGGTVKPTARYPASVAPGLASDDRTTLLVGFDGDTDVDAPHLAAHLRAVGVPFAVGGVTVEFPGSLDGTDQQTRLAHALDTDEDGVRRRLVERVKRSLKRADDDVFGEAGGADEGDGAGGGGVDGATGGSVEGFGDVERVGLPAVLGRDRPRQVRDALAEGLDAAVFELPPAPPSLPGVRLRYRLRDALREAGVAVTTGNPVVDFDVDVEADAAGGTAAGDAITTIYADRNGTRTPYEPGAVVLATGGLVGGGIDSERDAVYEPVFDCPVANPDDRYDWSDEDAFGPHAFARFGVRIDADGRVLDADGDPLYVNLTAAGGVVGGYDAAAEKSASGVSLATGYAAGATAAASTSQPTPTDVTVDR
ncbi:glycerol-3-phosphate dehydrogenase subunit GlpB [Halorubellus sp. PRR65]|uniref:glycerol-3-phosphate dehydrogenase subunit GlpB n=1 Tax=Halorubellus sp. PRR65 TaxID=3098148 RepID=UPI002B25FB82|nr:glycerol-3-phosphate dehydrogenase subunit GlpB [Halorubellus sp. PRR65]